MRLVRYALHKIVTFVQLLLILIFILFEELIWEGIAEPIYVKIHSLKILQRVEKMLAVTPRILILSFFLLIFLAVEGAGILAGVLFLQGKIHLGIGLYLMKIPIAAFTFWLFSVTKEKLLSFKWFAWLYHRVVRFFGWLKSLELYQETMSRLKKWKQIVKSKFQALKANYFSGENSFAARLRHLYIVMIMLFRRK